MKKLVNFFVLGFNCDVKTIYITEVESIMKIKIIQSWSSEKILEQKVNEFIQNINIKVLEMQYKSSVWAYSVMIVYEDKN